MSIIYSLVCKHQTASDDIVILTTYDSATGNYPTVVINLLKKLVGKQTRVTYEYGTEYSMTNTATTSMCYAMGYCRLCACLMSRSQRRLRSLSWMSSKASLRKSSPTRKSV